LDSSIIQGPFSVAPCQTLISRFATFFIAVRCSAVKVARALGAGRTVVTLLSDGGDRYRSTLYSRTWLEQHARVPTCTNDRLDFVM
jgi:hypothetical protein